MLDENTDKLLRNTSMAKKKEVRFFFVIGDWPLVLLCYWLLVLLGKHLNGENEVGECVVIVDWFLMLFAKQLDGKKRK